MTEVRGIEAFAEVRRLIVVAAHPDDLETMCGGTIALLVQREAKVFSVNCTLSDIGTQEANVMRLTLATTRLAETDEAARILGIEETHNLGHHDGELLPNLELHHQLDMLDKTRLGYQAGQVLGRVRAVFGYFAYHYPS